MDFDWMTPQEAADKWGITNRRVQALCANGQVEGVVRLKGGWMIPKGTPKPPDGRVRNGRKPANKRELNGSMSITITDIENGLNRLGVKDGMMLEVHCSLSSFGYVDGGALTVIKAIKNVVGKNGSIVMPSFKDSPNLSLNEADKELGLTLKIKLLKGDEEKSGMGIVSDTFRKMPDVITGEGQFRVSAWGKDVDKHAANWFNHLIAFDGYALLLGVDIYRMSTMHYVEDCLPKEIKDLFKPSEEAREIYPESEWFIEAWTPSAKPWYTIQEQAYEKGYITDTMIGNSKCMLAHVKNVIGLYKKALQTDPFGLYGLSESGKTDSLCNGR